MLNLLRNFSKNTSGAIAITWGITLPVIVGAIGIGVEVGLWFGHKRELQVATDAGAHAGAWVISIDGNDDPNVAVTDAARAGTSRLGFTHDGTIVDVDVRHPPDTGNHVNNDNYVEVVVRKEYEPYFARLFLGNIKIPISTRAVAQSDDGGGAGKFCILATSPDADQAFKVTGNANLDANCGIAVASNSDSAVFTAGSNFTVKASDMCVDGDVDSQHPTGFIDSDDNTQLFPETNCKVPEDPFVGLSMPDPGDCSCEADQPDGTVLDTSKQANVNLGSGDTMYPGFYCNKVNINGDVTMEPGIYFFANGLSMTKDQARLTGDGVLLVNTDQCGDGNFGDMVFNGGILDLTAMTSGPYSGILFWNDRSPGNTSSLSIGGNVDDPDDGIGADVDGFIYWNNPGGNVKFHGTPSAGFNCVAGIISSTVTLVGDPGLSNGNPDCETSGSVTNFGNSDGITVRLVE